MNYFDNIRKEIVLPSGALVTVRLQTKLEAILIGQPPAFFFRNARLSERGQPMPEETPEEAAQWAEFTAKQNRIILTRCCISPLKMGPEQWLEIADCDPGKEKEGQISWALLTGADANAIVEATNKLTAGGMTGGEAVKTFPEKQAPPGGTGSIGATLLLPSDRPAEAVA